MNGARTAVKSAPNPWGMKMTEVFEYSGKGKETGTPRDGLFTVKLLISNSDKLREDQLRRQHLGSNPAAADTEAADIAYAYAFCAVRLTDAPQWWKDANGGLDLLDTNILIEVNNLAYEKVKEAKEARQKAGVQAQDAIRKDQPSE
jgi:hypothetical protein